MPVIKQEVEELIQAGIKIWEIQKEKLHTRRQPATLLIDKERKVISNSKEILSSVPKSS